MRHAGDVRQCGFMAGIELVQDRDRKTPWPIQKKIGPQVVAEARRRGVIIRPLGDVIVLMPPLSITVKELETLLDAVYESIRAVTEKQGLVMGSGRRNSECGFRRAEWEEGESVNGSIGELVKR